MGELDKISDSTMESVSDAMILRLAGGEMTADDLRTFRAGMRFGKSLVAQRQREALDFMLQHGMYDGAHRKMWVIDQAVRILTGDDYDRVIAEFREGEDGPETYDWDTGIAP